MIFILIYILFFSIEARKWPKSDKIFSKGWFWETENGKVIKWKHPTKWNKNIKWLDAALSSMPNGEIHDFWNYVHDKGNELHKGKPKKFFYQNQAVFINAVNDLPKSKQRADDRVATHELNASGGCPEEIENLEEWDYGSGSELNVTIENRRIILTESVTVGHLEIKNGGILVFGEPQEVVATKPPKGKNGITIGGVMIPIGLGSKQEPEVKLRALSIHVSNNGEIWIGSRACRYQHKATISLYGDNDAMEDIGGVGKKFVWCSAGSTCEFHGKEKHSWTTLNDHLMKSNSPVEKRSFDYSSDENGNYIHGLGLHRLSRFGGWKDSIVFKTVEDQGQSLIDYFEVNKCNDDFNCNEDIYIIFSLGVWVWL